DDVPEDGPAALVPFRVQRGAQLGREEVAVVAADLVAERVLLGGEIEVHGGFWSKVKHVLVGRGICRKRDCDAMGAGSEHTSRRARDVTPASRFGKGR